MCKTFTQLNCQIAGLNPSTVQQFKKNILNVCFKRTRKLDQLNNLLKASNKDTLSTYFFNEIYSKFEVDNVILMLLVPTSDKVLINF